VILEQRGLIHVITYPSRQLGIHSSFEPWEVQRLGSTHRGAPNERASNLIQATTTNFLGRPVKDSLLRPALLQDPDSITAGAAGMPMFDIDKGWPNSSYLEFGQ